jgi:hypothetical protein
MEYGCDHRHVTHANIAQKAESRKIYNVNMKSTYENGNKGRPIKPISGLKYINTSQKRQLLPEWLCL